MGCSSHSACDKLSDGQSEPIVSRELWNKAQERLKREEEERLKGFSRHGNSHELFGRLFCADCGEPYMRCTFTKRNAKPGEDKYYKVWRCWGRMNGKCKNPIIKEEELLVKVRDDEQYIVTATGDLVTG